MSNYKAYRDERRIDMMTIKEAMIILDAIEVTPEQIEKSAKYMSDKIEQAMASKAYRRQGGVTFTFSDNSVAWIALWTMDGQKYLHLTERGEDIYLGTSCEECAEMLYKLGVAHKQNKNFLGCGR